MGGFAWVTLATNDSYSLGALVLAHSLKQTGTVHQLAVLVTPGVTSAMRDKLASVFNLVQEVNILDSRDEANLRLLKRPELGITFTKLHCWRLTQFDKCVFLDADTLVLQNSDELFEREELSAAPDVGWPDCFNSGVFVYRPSLDTYEKLIQFALEKGSFDGGDQGLLNLYFSDWAHKDISKHLPFIYNLCSTACYSYLPAFKQFGANAKIIHFIGAQKPWLQYFNTETKKVQPSGESSHLQEVLQLWWDIFCSLIHPHLSPAMQGQSQHGMSPSYFPPKYHPPPNPTASADDCESVWDPWDEYDEKMYQNITHYNQNQPIESLNTNTSPVANQPSIHSHSQSHNYSTCTVQYNSYYQPSSPNVVYQHLPRVPTPPPSPQPVYHPPPQFHPPVQHPEESHQQPSPCPPQYFPSEPQHFCHEPAQHSEAYYYHNEPHIESCESEQHYFQHHDHHYQDPVQHSKPQYHEEHEQHPHHYESHFTHEQKEVHEIHSQPFSVSPVRPRSPNPSDQNAFLPKECEATTTVSNDRSLSNTIEENSSQEDAGLAGAFSQLTLGVARTAEQDALENVLRKQAWEVGNIDYLGKDSFANIWSKITETLSAAPSQPEASVPEEPEISSAETEPEVAPAESQSQTALQDVATPVLPSVPPSDDVPKIDSLESSTVPEPLIISPIQTESVLPQTPIEAVPATEPTQETPIKPVEETKPVSIEKETEPKVADTEAPVVAGKLEEALVVADAPTAEIEASKLEEPVLATPEVQPAAPQIPDTPAPASVPNEEAKPPIAPAPSVSEPTAATSVTVLTEAASSPIEPGVEIPAATSPTEPSSEVLAQAGSIGTPTAAPVQEEAPAPPAAESPAVLEEEAQPLDVSPKTKVVEATPPATPGTPPATLPVEKAKQALTAEATVPETPPPSEGASTPTPPPRKTDKPKKAAAKPKK